MYAASRLHRPIQARRSSRGNALLNADDSHGVRAVWRLDLDLFADAMPDQRLSQRGLVADPTRFGVGFGGPDDPIALLIGAVLAEAHGAAHVDHARLGLGLDQHVVLDDLSLIHISEPTRLGM